MADEQQSTGKAWKVNGILLVIGAFLCLAGNISFLVASGFNRGDISSLVLYICWSLPFLAGGFACARAPQWKSSSFFQTGFSLLACLAVVGFLFNINIVYAGMAIFRGSSFGASPFAIAFWSSQAISLAGYGVIVAGLVRVAGLLRASIEGERHITGSEKDIPAE